METAEPTQSGTFRKLPKTYVRASGKSDHPAIETFTELEYIDANYRLFNLYGMWNFCRRDQNTTDQKVVDEWLKDYGASNLELCWYNHIPFVSARVLWDFYFSICKRDLCRSLVRGNDMLALKFIEKHGILAFYKEYDICEFPELQSECWVRLANNSGDTSDLSKYVTSSGRKF